MSPRVLPRHPALAAALLSLAAPFTALAQDAGKILPPTSLATKAEPALQRVLLSALEGDTRVGKGAYMMNKLGTRPGPAEAGAKCGQTALTLHANSQAENAKADFGITNSIPGKVRVLGYWAYLDAASNVRSAGLQITDAEGEHLLWKTEVQGDGWQWVEVLLEDGGFEQAYPQEDKNGTVDLPLKGVNIVWYSEMEGETTFTVDGLVAVTEVESAPAAVTGELAGGSTTEANLPLQGSYVLTNYTDKPVAAKLQLSLQRDPNLAAPTPPDPVLGTDHALGTKSWTEYDGKKVEEGSLTDGNENTAYQIGWNPGAHQEVLQFIDLGQERTITTMRSWGGDANWIQKIDVSASLDGEKYEDIPGATGLDFHGKWGGNLPIPLATPLRARFLKFRYHNDGEAADNIAAPVGISIYDGTADETWEIPSLGEVVLDQSIPGTIPPRSFTVVNISTPAALTPGAYLLSAKVDAGPTQFMTQHEAFALTEALPKVGPESMFGINGSNPDLAPVVRRLGVGWFRFENMKWAMFSPAPGEFAFDGSVGPWHVNADEILKGYTDLGISHCPMMFMTPLHASSADESIPEGRRFAYPPKDNAEAGEYWFQAAARYGANKDVPAADLKTSDKVTGQNLIKVYEVWNEQNLNDPGWGPWVGTMEQYYDLMREASEGVKRADPAAIVSNGGFGGADVALVEHMRNHKFADGKSALDFVDLLNIHYYSGRVPPEIATMDPNVYRTGEVQGGRPFEDEMKAMVEWRDTHKPGAPIWLTETGYDTAGPYGVSERLQAARIPRMLMLALGQGIDKVFLYREVGSTPSQHSAAGVLRNDGSKKPSFFTFANLTRELDGAKADKRLPYPDENVRVYAWTRKGEKLVTAWAVQGTASLDLPLGAATITDAFGGKSTHSGTALLPLSEFPVYISGISDYAALENAIEQRGAAAAALAKAEEERLAATKAYLFDMGVAATEAKIKIGVERKFTAVSADCGYEDGADFGFSPDAASNDSAGWIKDPLNSTFCRVGPDASFTFAAEPGKYQLRLAVLPFGDTLQVEITGAGEDIVKEISNQPAAIEEEIVVGTAPITIRVNDYARFSWLTLIDTSVTDYVKPHAE